MLLIPQQEEIIYDLATSQVKCYSSKLINRSGNNFLFDAQSLLSEGSQSSFSPPLLLCVLCLCHSCSPPGHLLPLYQLIHNYPVSLCAFLFSGSPLFPFLLTFSYLSLTPFPAFVSPLPSFRGLLIHLLSTCSLINMPPLCLSLFRLDYSVKMSSLFSLYFFLTPRIFSFWLIFFFTDEFQDTSSSSLLRLYYLQPDNMSV